MDREDMFKPKIYVDELAPIGSGTLEDAHRAAAHAATCKMLCEAHPHLTHDTHAEELHHTANAARESMMCHRRHEHRKILYLMLPHEVVEKDGEPHVRVRAMAILPGGPEVNFPFSARKPIAD